MDVNRAAYAPPPPPAPVTGGGEVVAAVQAPAPNIPMPGASTAEVQGVEGIDTLRRAVGEINASMATHGRHLSIEFHEATGRRMVTVYDSETNEAIREIPPQRVLDAHAHLLELAGLFVDSRG